MPPSANQEKGHTHGGAVEPPAPIWTVLLAIVFFVQLYLTVGSYKRLREKSADQDATTLTDPAGGDLETGNAKENASPSSTSKEGEEQLEAPALAPAAAHPSVGPPPASSYPRGQGHPRFRPNFTLWLVPYLTTRWHKVAALAVYLAILGVQLLDAWCLKELRAGMTAELFGALLDGAREGRWFFAGYFALAVGVGFVLDLWILCVGGLVVCAQLLCIVELYSFARYY